MSKKQYGVINLRITFIASKTQPHARNMINAFEKKIEDLTLSEETAAFRRAATRLIKADEFHIIHMNALLSIIFDPIAFVKAYVAR